MKIRQVIENCAVTFTQKYGDRLGTGQRKALDAMLACRRHCGEFHVHCDGCGARDTLPLSCGHRSCPQCQHHLGRLWLERQKQKLLPVEYFMVTFTLPSELRTLARQQQSLMYELLFKASVEAIRTIGRNNHGIELAMTGVLHTHKRDKGFHPHMHLVVPGGGLTTKKGGTSWKALDEKFLVNEFVLAKIFRGILLRLLFEHAVPLPYGIPKQWVTNIRAVGQGEKALEYLSRYLYRGVISENDILTNDNNEVIFRYRESKTKVLVTKKLAPEDFLWRILQHVLPRGFRRVRDYGFLHANARLILNRVQLLLRVKLPEKQVEKTPMSCNRCKSALKIIMVNAKKIPMQFRFYVTPITSIPPI